MGVDAMNDRLVVQVRAVLADAAPIMREVKMFGGVGFMFQGNLIAAASTRGLLVRVGPPGEAEALARPGARLMIMRGRPMTGYVRVEPAALDARGVKGWMKLARAFVETLPPKAPGQNPRTKRDPQPTRRAGPKPATAAGPKSSPKPTRKRRPA